MFRATMYPSSREIIVSMRQLVFVTLCGWRPHRYAGCTLHSRQLSTQSDKYQVSHRCSYFSWWSALIRPKLMEKRNKHTKKNCTPSWLYLQDGIVCLHSIFKDCLPVLLVDARNRTAPNTCLVSPEPIIVDEMPISVWWIKLSTGFGYKDWKAFYVGA